MSVGDVPENGLQRSANARLTPFLVAGAKVRARYPAGGSTLGIAAELIGQIIPRRRMTTSSTMARTIWMATMISKPYG